MTDLNLPETIEGDRGTYIAETWMFAGSHTDDKGKRSHAWLPLPAKDLSGQLIYDVQGSGLLVGGEYVVYVYREDGHVWKRGKPAPVYVGLHENAELRALAEARHKAVEALIRTRRRVASDKRDSALEDALAPLTAISAKLHPTERTAFLAYVIQKITKPW